mgnify:CR=1 FL=1
MKDFRKLEVWQKTHGLVLSVYRETTSFPKEEIYGLTSQIRRAAVSIPANIAEGCGRNGDPELAHFLQMAAGSPANCPTNSNSPAISATSPLTSTLHHSRWMKSEKCSTFLFTVSDLLLIANRF